jgi:hypothetical protein
MHLWSGVPTGKKKTWPGEKGGGGREREKERKKERNRQRQRERHTQTHLNVIGSGSEWADAVLRDAEQRVERRLETCCAHRER